MAHLGQVGQVAISGLLLGGAIGYVASQAAWPQIFAAAAGLSWTALATASLLMITGALLASLRLWYIGRDLGYHLTFREAVSALGLGQIAGLLFFQIVGQLMARSAFLSRRSVPVAGTVLATGYERLSALAVSLVFAVSAAIYLFGRISVNAAEGGLLAIKVFIGLIVAGLAGALLSWGRPVVRNFLELTSDAYRSLARNLVLSIVIQLTTMAAYVVLARSLVPSIPIVSLVAASALVMFTASLPISFAGWGMREMSAIFALGVIGVSAEASLTVAATIGIISIIVVGLLATTAIGHPPKLEPDGQERPAGRILAFDAATILEMSIPVFAATAVFFQIFVPINKGLVNVNLADPIVLLGGALFVINHFARRWPQWRIPHINLYFGLITFLIAISFLFGLASFGLTNWAFTNRFLGWFVILSYAATGALIVQRAKRDGLDLLLHTYASAATSIAALEIVLLLIFQFSGDFVKPLIQIPFVGFTENRNAFAFQLLLAACAIMCTRWKHAAILLGIIFAGIFFSGSRATFIALPFVVVMCAYMRRLDLGMVIKACLIASALVLLAIYGPLLPSQIQAPEGHAEVLTLLLSAPSSNAERLKSLIEGWEMFLAHPVFGAGLGAFMHQSIQTGVPLVIHSTALWIMAEMGLIGLFVFALPAVRIFWIEASHPKNADVAAAILVLILTSFAVVSSAHDIAYQRAFWIFLGAALALVPDRLEPASRPAYAKA